MMRSSLVRLLVTLCVGVLIISGLVGALAWRARQVAIDSRAQVTALREGVTAQGVTAQGDAAAVQSPASSMQAVRQACSQAGELQRSLGPIIDLAGAAAPANQLIGRLPQIGEQAAAMLMLGQAAGEISAGLRMGCDALDPLVDGPTGIGDLSSFTAKLAPARDTIREATARLRSGQAKLAGIDVRGLDDATARFVVDVRDRLPAATARLALLAELPGLLGQDGPRSFLVLGQNTDEIRATGGFIGTAGVVTFDGGRVTRQEYGTSTRYNTPATVTVPLPELIRRHYPAENSWHLLGSNWWPDFPSAAQQARYFYGLTRPDDLAGVIALDQDLLVYLIGITGPIEVPAYGEVVTAENLRDRLDFHIHEQDETREEVRKGFVSALFPLLIDRLVALPADRVPDLTGAMLRGLTEQHLLIWSADNRAQQSIADLSWDGRMLAAAGDYLFPVSVNVSANKINRAIERELEYDVREDENGRLIGHAALVLRNRRTGPADGPRSDTYKDFLRVYVPAGSELLAASGLDSRPRVTTECGRTAFAGLVNVRPGGEERVELQYRLPSEMDWSNYTLTVQKQAGSGAFPLRVSGPATGSTRTELQAHRTFASGGGRLVDARLRPENGAAPTQMACDIHDDLPWEVRTPAELRIPRLDVRAPVTQLGVLPDGTLDAPTTGQHVGWYTHSQRPGQAGNLVMAGHLDWEKRPAVFARLQELRPGDRVGVVGDGGAWYEYEVEWTRRVNATSAPLDEVLGRSQQRWLTLITCGGVFNQNTRDYEERLVVRAKLVSAG